MKLSRLLPSLFLLAVISAFWSAKPAAAAVSSGSLVKTSGNSAVYLYGSDGNRHAFPNEKIFYSWFLNFDGVKEITLGELSAMPLGRNVTYRPGARLVKITTDPKVYAVQGDNTLRPINSEYDAGKLYGSDWATRVDDLPDVFFVDYSVGETLFAADGWPDDTVIKSAEGDYYVLEGGAKRKLTGEAATNLSRFSVADSGALAGIVESAGLGAPENPYSPSQGEEFPETPTFSAVAVGNGYISSGEDQTLVGLRIRSAPAVTVTGVNLRFRALKDLDTDDTDEDLGGLVYGNNIRTNLTGIRIVDSQGYTVFGPGELTPSIFIDENQTLRLAGNLNLPANGDKMLFLKARIEELLPDGENYSVTLLKTGTSVSSEGKQAAFAPATDMVLGYSVVRSRSTTIENDWKDNQIVRGAKGVGFTSFKLTAGSVDTYLREMTMSGALDSETYAGFGIGGDTDYGLEVRLNRVVPKVSIAVDGETIARDVYVPWDGRIRLSGLGVKIPAGRSVTVSVYGDVPITVPLGNKPDRVAFGISLLKDDLGLYDEAGNVIYVRAAESGYNLEKWRTSIVENGKLHMEWSSLGGIVFAGNEIDLGKVTFESTYDDYSVQALSFYQSSDTYPQGSFQEVRLEYVDSSGAKRSSTIRTSSRQLDFSGLDIYVKRGSVAEAKLVAKCSSISGGAQYDGKISLAFEPERLLQFRSVISGQTYDQGSLGSSDTADFYSDNGVAASAVIRFGSLTVASEGPLTGDLVRDNNADTLKFKMTASGGPIKIKNMSFFLTPSDAGSYGSDNDAIEYWADLDPETDANSIGDLVRVQSGNETIVGEDWTASVDYFIIRGASRLPDSTVDSKFGDTAVVKYTWNSGSEYTIAAGETAHFIYRLDTRGFWRSYKFSENRDYNLVVKMEQSPYFYWTDSPGINYTPRSSVGIGLPISATYKVLMP